MKKYNLIFNYCFILCFLALSQNLIGQIHTIPNYTFKCGNAGQTQNASQPVTTLSIPSPPVNCTSPASIKYIKIYIHYLLKSDSTGNFRPHDDGLIGSPTHIANVTGYNRAARILGWLNSKMAQNYPMFLPNLGVLTSTNVNLGINTTPVLSKRVQFIIPPSNPNNPTNQDGIQFHYSDQWYNGTLLCLNCDLDVDQVYGVNRGSAINVYYIGLPGYAEGEGNIIPYSSQNALIIKVRDWDAQDVFYQKDPDWDGPGHLLCHELCHTLGLEHDFENDGCDDTPLHGGCFNYLDTNDPNCNSYDKISNNTMSYLGGYNESLSPCQIGRIQDRLESYLSPYVDHCAIDCSQISPSLFLDVSPLNLYAASSSIVSSAIIDGNRTVINEAPNITLNSTTYTAVNVTPNVTSTHNFEVKLGTTFIARPYTCDAIQGLIAAPSKSPQNSVAYVNPVKAQEETSDNTKSSLKVYPSPTKGELFINYNLSGTSTTRLSVINITGEVVQTVKQPEEQQQGHYKIGINVTNYQNGVYFIFLETASGKTVEKFVVQK